MLLKELYDLKLMDYKLNGKKEKPDKLLAMLLLQEKDKYEPLMISEGEFYQHYKDEIDKKIVQVEKDFDLDEKEIIKLIEEKGFFCDDYVHDKIWFVFCEGFGAMYWGLMYKKENTPEEIYAEYFDNEILLSSVELKYKKLYNMCNKYSEINLSNNLPSFNLETDWKKVAENGFIEKFGLNDSEREKLEQLRKTKEESIPVLKKTIN
jgi:hypothetical protein